MFELANFRVDFVVEHFDVIQEVVVFSINTLDIFVYKGILV